MHIGIDLGGTNIRAGLVRKGKIISYSEKKVDKNRSLVPQLNALIEKIFSTKVKGIGISAPAIMDTSKGVLYEAFNLPKVKNLRLKQVLGRKYKVPVKINNDANCFALGEKNYGQGKKYKNIVGVIIGTGFGAGIIIDGRLYEGNSCSAGEFGRIPFKDKTIEDYCSGKFFKAKGKEIAEKAKKKNKKALSEFREYGSNLGMGLSAIVNSLNPDLIVLGGGVSDSYKFFKVSMIISLKQHTYSKAFSNVKIKVSSRKNIAILGAVSLF